MPCSRAMNSRGRSDRAQPGVHDMKIIYKTSAVSVGGRAGDAETDDGQLKVDLVRPKERGGTGEGGTNPEQLFACGYAACFASTLEHIARAKKVTLDTVTVHSEI